MKRPKSKTSYSKKWSSSKPLSYFIVIVVVRQIVAQLPEQDV